MKAEEAIKFFKPIVDNEAYTDRFQDACNLAIEALEKQIPKKVVNFEKACDTYGDCPRCGESHWFEGDDSFNYCPDCGQALDWSEEE